MDSPILNLYTDKYKIGPLYVRRLCYIVQEFPHLKECPQIARKLLNLICAQDSLYRYFNDTLKLIRFLQNQGDDVTEYWNHYEQAIKPLISAGQTKINETLSTAYDEELSQYSKSEATAETFDQLVEILKRKSLDTLMATASSDFINDNSSYYYNLSPEYLPYYKKISLQELERLVVYKNYDNSLASSQEFLRRKLQQVLDYEKNDSDDNDDDRMMLDEQPRSTEFKLSDEETVSYWNCRWYLIYAAFQNNDYIGVVDEFETLLTEASIGDFSAVEVLSNHYHNELILDTFLLRIIFLSILIVKPAQKFTEYWQKPLISQALAADPDLKRLAKSYINCEFLKLKDAVGVLEDQFKLDYQLKRCFAFFKRVLRFKTFVVYLAPIKKVSIKHMSEVFGIEETELQKEIFKLISTFELNVKFDQTNGVLESVSNSSMVCNFMHKLDNFSKEVLVEMRALEVNSLVLQAFNK